MTTITATPSPVNWSRNNIIFKLRTDAALTEPGLAIEVQLYFKFLGSTANAPAILDVALTPDSNGEVTINLRKVLDNQLNYQLPATGITECNQQSGTFNIAYRELKESTLNPLFVTGTPYTVIKGGLPQEKWTPAYFNNFNFSFRYFMTWKKSGYLVNPADKEYITYLHLQPTIAANSKAAFKIWYTDGTFTTFDLASTVQFKENGFYHFPTGIQDLGLDALTPAKKIFYYTVQPFGDGAPLTQEPFVFNVDYRNFYESVTLHYFNSLSGFGTCRILGDIEKEVNRMASISNKYSETDPYSQESEDEVEEKVVYKCNVGYMEDPDEQDNLRDFLLSKRKYHYKWKSWRLIRVMSDQISFGSKGQNLFDLPFEWTYAVTNDSYAPDYMSFGEVIIPPPPVCVPVTIPAASLPDATVNQSYFFTIQLQGTAPFTLSNKVRPAGMEIGLNGDIVTISGVPTTQATNVAISFTISNCGGATANFSDTIDVAAVAAPPSGATKNAYVINNSGTYIQITSDGVVYPATPTPGNFNINILEGSTIGITAGSGYYLVEFLASMGGSPNYSVTLDTGDTFHLSADPNDPQTGVNNINYIIISK